MKEEKIFTAKDYINGLPSYIRYILIYVIHKYHLGYKLLIRLSYLIKYKSLPKHIKRTENCLLPIVNYQQSAFYRRGFRLFEVVYK